MRKFSFRYLLLLEIVIGSLLGLWIPFRASALPPSGPEDNALFFPLTLRTVPQPREQHARIIAFVPDGYAFRDADEAFAIQNVGTNSLFLWGWQVTDGEGRITLPDITLLPGDSLWCARQATAFTAVWGEKPGCEYGEDTDPDVPDATGHPINFNNKGDELQLLRPLGQVADAVVFGDMGDATIEGWSGDVLFPYTPTNAFARTGQVFYRLFDPVSHLPLKDTDTRADWAQGNRDPILGKRTAYPGWDLVDFILPLHLTYDTPLSANLLVTPDNALAPLLEIILTAESHIYVESYELTHPSIVEALARKAQAGLDVRVLLEGGPAGGLTDDSRWAAQQLVEAGARVDFMVNDVNDAHDRYPYLHAKFIIIDSHTLVLSTENFKLASLPADTEDGETLGRRGYMVIFRETEIADRAKTIFMHDDDYAHHDIFPWQPDHPQYGRPHDPNYQPPQPEDLMGYRVRYPQPFRAEDVSEAVLFTAPEASLTPLLSLIDQAGPGDIILTQQLFEHPYWGPTNSNARDDPNVRLEALIAAARRGATVRILLDNFFDDPNDIRSNLNTINYLNDIAQSEVLDLKARRGNPAGTGLHAKLYLLAIGGQRWVIISSMNGGEASNKLNREMGLALQTEQGYNALATVFWNDWNAPTIQQTPVP